MGACDVSRVPQKKYLPRRSLASAAKAGTESKPLIAAVNRCATQKQGVTGALLHSKHMQGWRVLRITMRFYQDFNVLIECHEKAKKALHGKLPELSAQHLGDIGLADAEEIGRLDLFQAPFFHERVDFENKLRLNEVLVRIRQAEILEHVPAAVFVSLLAHRALFGFRVLGNSRHGDITISWGSGPRWTGEDARLSTERFLFHSSFSLLSCSHPMNG